MTPIDLVQSILLAAALAVAAYAAFRRHNHIETGLRAQLDQALEENKRLDAERKRLEDELHAAKAKVTTEQLDEHAMRAVLYAEQLGGTGAQKLLHACKASIKFDLDANGLQDWTDTQHRIAVEAAVAKLKARPA